MIMNLPNDAAERYAQLLAAEVQRDPHALPMLWRSRAALRSGGAFALTDALAAEAARVTAYDAIRAGEILTDAELTARVSDRISWQPRLPEMTAVRARQSAEHEARYFAHRDSLREQRRLRERLAA